MVDQTKNKENVWGDRAQLYVIHSKPNGDIVHTGNVEQCRAINLEPKQALGPWIDNTQPQEW